MTKSILTLFLLLSSTHVFSAEVERLHANEWLVPKNNEVLLAMPAINKSMHELQKSTNRVLKIKYPGGDEGTLWVNELQSWLVALGLSSARIELVQGSANSTTIELEVLSN